MAYAQSNHPGPMGEMNMTPLIDVLLVLLIMFVITVPLAAHQTNVDLPNGPASEPNEVVNKIVVTEGGALLWNGKRVDERQLVVLLEASALSGSVRRPPSPPQPTLTPHLNFRHPVLLIHHPPQL